jgi:beta-lactamase class A
MRQQHPIIHLLLGSFIFLLSCQTPSNELDQLRKKIETITSSKRAVVGISMIGNGGKDTLSFYGERHFPMQSVFKFHIALAVLAEVDKGKLSLDQPITIGKEKLLPESFWSPLRDENPNGGVFTIARLIQYHTATTLLVMN